MPALTQVPNARPEGSTYSKAFATSDMYVGVPAIAAGLATITTGTGSFTATLLGVQPTDLLVLEPPLALNGADVTAGCSVMYMGHRITAVDTVVVFFRSIGVGAVAAGTPVAWRYKWWDMTPSAEVGLQNPS